MAAKDGFIQLNAQVPEEDYNNFQTNSRKAGRDVTKNINYLIREFNKQYAVVVPAKKSSKKTLKK